MYDLSNQNSLKLQSTAETYLEFSNTDELVEISKNYGLEQGNFCVIGEGTNSIFPISFKNIVLKAMGKDIKIINNHENILIEVSAGLEWDDLIDFCCEKNFYGLENLAGIPGTVGAAPVQNIGAYGKEISENISKIEVFDIKQKTIKYIDNEECKFSYRDSFFKKNKHLIITSVFFSLSSIFNANLNYRDLQNKSFSSAQALINFIRKIRLKKIPDRISYPNLGSFFKNPIIDKKSFNKNPKLSSLTSSSASSDKVKLSAAEIIESLGLKGMRINGCGMSAQHALVLVCTGFCNANDIRRVEKTVKEIVFNEYQINLETEPFYL